MHFAPIPQMRLLVVCLFIASALTAGQKADKAEHVGGTVAGLPRGAGVIDLTSPRQFVFRTDSADLKIPYDRVNLLEYGQQVDRRYAMAIVISPLLLLSKKRQHFLTIGFADQTGAQQALVLKVDKRNVRTVLASLEARTGRKVEFQDIEARKAGKG
ncbi:MAG TPA: hypothetical protein VN428_20225 [Bryobacteraceae bacterium]|nr:hypothetical protein [Bryobacteraceae bacterium]